MHSHEEQGEQEVKAFSNLENNEVFCISIEEMYIRIPFTAVDQFKTSLQ